MNKPLHPANPFSALDAFFTGLLAGITVDAIRQHRHEVNVADMRWADDGGSQVCPHRYYAVGGIYGSRETVWQCIKCDDVVTARKRP